jgi:hypothetical protein
MVPGITRLEKEEKKSDVLNEDSVSALPPKVAATARSEIRRTKDDLEATLPIDNFVDTPAPSRSPVPAPPSGLAPIPEIEYPPAKN